MKKVLSGSSKLIKKFLVLSLIAALLGTMFGKTIETEAVFDKDQAITYQDFASKVTVDDCVLFIGTYIIHKDALNNQLSEKAKQSAAESGQSNVYYKSEAGDGNWFNIGDIENGVKGISTEGNPENIQTINPLYVTYYVGKDGILKDAKTMASKNPFDIPDPYDLSSLIELEPIRSQYTDSQTATSISQSDFLSNKGSKDSGTMRSDVYYYQILSTFFSLDLRDAQTNKCDQQLQSLNGTYLSLKGQGKEEEAALVFSLMEKVDATRRALIMERLAMLDENLLNTLNTLASGDYYTPYGNFKDSSSANSTATYDYTIELQDSLKHNFTGTNNASSFVQSLFSSIGVTSSSSGWWTVLEKYESDRSKRDQEANKDNEDYVQDKSQNEYPFSADEQLIEAIGTAIGNCANSYTTYLSKALVDTDDILGHAIYDYSSQVIAQTSGTTLSGPIDNLKHATNIKDNKISDKEGELQLLKNSLIDMAANKYFASATEGAGPDYSQQSSEGSKKSYLEDQKAKEESYRTMLEYLIEARRQRETPADCLEYVNQRIKDTESLLTSIPADDYKTYSTSSVQAHLAWLRAEVQKIIDSDESLKSKTQKLLDKKKELQAKRDACLDNNDLSGAAAYDAKIKAVDQDIAAEGGDTSSLTDKLVDKAMDKLADNANADLSGIADALAQVGANDKLNDLSKKAADSGASANTLAGINSAKNSQTNSVDSDALLAQLEALFGKSLDEMKDDELAVAGATVSRLSRMGITPAESLTKLIVNKLVDNKNRFTYLQYTGSKSYEYISMSTLSRCSNFRYFYDDARATATMTKGSTIYIFRRGSDEMYKQSTETEPEKLKLAIVSDGTVHIGEDDANTYFKCISEYCYGTNYAICLTASRQTKVEEYTKSLQEFFNQQ